MFSATALRDMVEDAVASVDVKECGLSLRREGVCGGAFRGVDSSRGRDRRTRDSNEIEAVRVRRMDGECPWGCDWVAIRARQVEGGVVGGAGGDTRPRPTNLSQRGLISSSVTFRGSRADALPKNSRRGRRKGCGVRGEIVGGVRRVCGQGARPRDEDAGSSPEGCFFWDDEHKNARGLVLGSPGVTAARCGRLRVSRRRGARRRARGRWRRSVSVFIGV